ncbi:MAG: hypothetical protein K2L27_03765 [Muribaculaceae bacterium]|nr:hypothetical protein [Muribaculaceae bacterium]
MNCLLRHIEHLLATHDCVTIPGVGAVLAHRERAVADAAAMRVLAPARAFTFNPALDHNDGLLASSVARAEGISYEAAAQRVEAAAEAMRATLGRESRLQLGRIGALTRHSDGSLRFAPGRADAISPATMWLPEVDLRAFAGTQTAADTPRRSAATRSVRAGVPRRIAARALRAAAAVALLVAVGLTLITPLKVDNPRYASLGVEPAAAVAPASASIADELPGRATAPVVLVLRQHADAATAVDTAAIAAARAARVASAPRRSYCLVVASLDSDSEVQRYLATQGDPSLRVLVSGDRYRVYAAEAATPEAVLADAAARGITERYPSSWICRR